MNKLKIPFFSRFATAGGIVLTVVILVAHGYYTHRTAEELRRRVDQKAVFITSFLAFPFSDALQAKDDVRLVQVLEQLEKDPDVLSMVVVDDRGEIRYNADPNKIGEDNKDEEITKVAKANEPSILHYTNKAGGAMALIAPLKIQGRSKPLGVARIDMTYKNVDVETAKARDSFTFYAFGIFLFAISIILTALRAWVSKPIHMMKNYLRSVSPMSAEAHLPEGEDDLGQLNKAINELILKFRTEIQNQSMAAAGQGTQEAELLSQTIKSLMPDSRILLISRDNIVISDTSLEDNLTEKHLLDIATDGAFANLLAAAFQGDGSALGGAITWNEKPAEAIVLRLSDFLTQKVKLLVLINKEMKNK